MKKLLSFILCAMMAFGVVSGAAAPDTVFDAAVTSYAAEAYNEDMLPYLYYQLSDTEKEHYLKLRTAAINMDKTVAISLTESELTKLVNIIDACDVLTCFNYEGMSYSYDRRTRIISKVTFDYTFSKKDYDKIISKADEISGKVISKFTDKTSKYAKIKYIHDYIIKKCTYSKTSVASDNIYGALVKGQAKCDGYAHAFNYICTKAGIRTVTVAGVSKGEGHAWNKVYYNKKWYNVDVTWDDPSADMKNFISYDYFMLSDKALAKTHREGVEGLKFPAADDDSQGYYVKNKLTASTEAEAKKLLVSEVAKAADKGINTVSIKLTDKSLYNKLNNSAFICGVIKEANNKTKKNLVTVGYITISSENDSFVFMFFNKDKSVSDYYVNPDKLSSEMKKFFKDIGMK